MTNIGRKTLGLARTVVLFELRLWRSLYRWVLRRPRASEPGAETFSSAGAVTPAIIAFIVVSAIEIPILHLILPWRIVQITSFVVGVQSVLWMIGLLASLRVHPHIVSASGLRIRHSSTIDIPIPWDAIAAIRTRIRSLPTGKTVQYDLTGPEPILHIAVSSQTNVDVVLRGPTTFPLPKGGSESVTELRFYADDSSALANRAREFLAADLSNSTN